MKLSRFLIRLTIFLLAPLVASVVTYMTLQSIFLSPVAGPDAPVVLYELAPGKTFKEVCKGLQEKGLVKYWFSPYVLSRLGSKDTRKIKAGEYELRASMTPKEILMKLLSGEVFKRIVLVREGANLNDVSKAVQDAGLVSAQEFLTAAKDMSLVKAAGIKGDTFEGYLFPETYNFSRPITPKDILWRMLEEGDKHWPPQFTEKANEINLSRHEILTLASIIEKESGNKDEQPMISSVFHNRLNQGMRLQSDPTVIYGLKNYDGNIRKEDLLSPHPYNTYVNFGLPPGPIANPGDTAIRAALFPSVSTFIFFVADGKGGHTFSATLADHNDAVARYLALTRQPAAAPSPTPQPTAAPTP